MTNPDLVYPDATKQPKLTVGSVFSCFCHLVEQISGVPVQNTVKLGKPNPLIYQCALNLLKKHPRYDIDLPIFAIGDSLKSDISGANQNGLESVLVLTGLVKNTNELDGLDAQFQPKHIF